MPIPSSPPPYPSTRNIGWIVIVSFLAAILLSFVLVTIVVPGAHENVISAAVILAFALGAGLLAMLSARRSDQPQRWALIAAGWLALAGISLVVAGSFSAMALEMVLDIRRMNVCFRKSP